MKKITSLLLASSLIATLAIGADFSKKSNDEIINLAKSVKAQDQADLVIEMKKRMNEMKFKDAKEFQYKFKTNLYENISKLSPQERSQRRAIVQKDMQDLTDKMSGKEIRELNLHGNHHGKRNFHAHQNMHHENCPMR
ncbi:DUF1104 domain-containing protein [Campylobacter peloridis]|uniref:DUF1104 domain-containing protein n=1 Tax=Campylobacter peloridis TaxID=488546 RepID=A0A5C7DQ48_9BACT|nr:DUF1104 domain-containing protein [Campylobacter peloridis]TXE79647.1 DUF1104 domain-containing protein [Campylobacter peloridis]